VIDFSNYSAFS